MMLSSESSLLILGCSFLSSNLRMKRHVLELCVQSCLIFVKYYIFICTQKRNLEGYTPPYWQWLTPEEWDCGGSLDAGDLQLLLYAIVSCSFFKHVYTCKRFSTRFCQFQLRRARQLDKDPSFAFLPVRTQGLS